MTEQSEREYFNFCVAIGVNPVNFEHEVQNTFRRLGIVSRMGGDPRPYISSYTETFAQNGVIDKIKTSKQPVTLYFLSSLNIFNRRLANIISNHHVKEGSAPVSWVDKDILLLTPKEGGKAICGKPKIAAINHCGK